RYNLSRNGFFFHLISEKENSTEKPVSQHFSGTLYLSVNNLGYHDFSIPLKSFSGKMEKLRPLTLLFPYKTK
ncbi:hypothetical protein, partial [Oikeobacillus pervagus]|uniref:hypothetical protein n=1 Tax=Oikeobacillus pervagus TaxID=1325931 RepID=UPI0027D7F121